MFHVAAAAALLVLPATALYAQDGCQCSAPGGEDSRIANAIGGGLFAGLLAAVIPFHHATALASAAPGAGAAPEALTTMSDSTDIAPGDSSHSRALASTGDPAVPFDPNADASAPISRSSNGESASPLPSITAGEAAEAGLIAPKTATILPALGMIGVGAMLLGIFFLRVRHPRLRSR
ncbi:MAG TPA: hypothetical protein VGO46_02575 [Gemmatimonadaceae bacterium]|jgi:hypothetical protein|nr:hypothetical protein [Gemmatimonadaceae bacterium]